MELEEYKPILTAARNPFLDLLSSCSTAEITRKPDQESWCSIETFQHLVQSDVYHFADILRPLNNDQFDLITLFGSKVESDTTKIFQTIPSPDGQMSKVDLLGLQNDIYEIFPQNDFAITDLSHSKTVIEIEGNNSKEVLKRVRKKLNLDINIISGKDEASIIANVFAKF